MSYASERDLFARSLAGDWQSRVFLYRKFFHDNLRVRRLGAKYPDLDDFLHDCFTNVLRAGHNFDGAGRLSEHVEAVGAWTALERERLRRIGPSVARNFIRMCAAIEGHETNHQARPATYVPPRSGTDDSLSSRISEVVGEPQFTMLRARELDHAAWENIAAAAGKPVNAVAPILIRAVDRLLRFFGAPPPLNEDLGSVFSEVAVNHADTRLTASVKPKGRVVSMQLDPAFYSVTPDRRKLGLSVPAEVRTITLWDAARASVSPGPALREHLAACHYCAEVLRALLLMQQAMYSAANSDFLLCPGAATLLRDPGETEHAFHRHLAVCGLCREEQTRARGCEERVSSRASRTAPTEPKLGKKLAWAAAATASVGGILVSGLRHFTANKPTTTVASETSQNETETAFDTKYADLAQPVSVDDRKLIASVSPQNQLVLMEAIQDLKGGNFVAGKMIAERIANQSGDPGAKMLYAVCLYAESALQKGYREMRKAEAMSPRNSFRCWATLQTALLAGDKATAEREIEHLSSDPDYASRARVILARMLERR